MATATIRSFDMSRRRMRYQSNLSTDPRMAAATVVLLLLSLATISLSSDPDCVYSVYIRTGSIIKGGTDSIISLTLYSGNGDGILIKDVMKWGGLMGSDYKYFERGNLDIFSGRGPCLSAPICAMNLTSNGSGPYHGWYCEYVEVTTAAVHSNCSQQHFTVEQWLAEDAPPFELSTFRNYCPDYDGASRNLIKWGSPDLAHVMQ